MVGFEYTSQIFNRSKPLSSHGSSALFVSDTTGCIVHSVTVAYFGCQGFTTSIGSQVTVVIFDLLPAIGPRPPFPVTKPKATGVNRERQDS